MFAGGDIVTGAATVIEAMGALGAQTRYLLVGQGPDRERLEALAGRLGLADRVIFAGPLNETSSVTISSAIRSCTFLCQFLSPVLTSISIG